MKIFKNKFLVKLIASLCLFLTLLNFGLQPQVNAEDKKNEEVFGGVLLTPVMHLLTAIGDAIMDILHLAILEQEESLIRLDGTADTWWNRHGAKVLGWLAAIVVVAVVVITAIPSGGTSLVAGGGFLAYLGATCFVIKTAAVAVGAGLVSGFLVTKVVDSSMMADDVYLPVYRVTPEEIFSNELGLFDVNFFNPQQPQQNVVEKVKSVTEGYELLYSMRYYSDAYAEYADLNAADKVIVGDANIPSWMKLWDNSIDWLSITGYGDDLPSHMFEEGSQVIADSSLLQCFPTSSLAKVNEQYKTFFETLKAVLPYNIDYLNSEDILMGRCTMTTGPYNRERYYIFQKNNDNFGIKIQITYEANNKERIIIFNWLGKRI